MENNEHSLGESACMCGKGTLKVSYRILDNGNEGIEHLWEHEVKEMGRVKSKKLFHKPKFIRIIYEIKEANQHKSTV